MIRVVIIDDHPLARVGLAQILADSGRVAVSAVVADGGEALAHLAAAVPDPGAEVVVCDLYHGGDEPCLESVRDLTALARTLVISASGRPGDVIGAIRAGAAGYVTKHADPAMIVAAVETVASGGFALSAQLADIVHADMRRPAGARPALSAREEQALSLIADGLTHAQVAARMGVSRSTVDTYVERIRAKLQVGNKAQLTRAALERALAAAAPSGSDEASPADCRARF